MFVQTVRQNYEGFTKKELEKATISRESPGLIGAPSERELNYLVSRNLDSFHVTILYVENSHKIFRPILGGVSGNNTRQNPEHVTTDYVDIPRDFLALHKYVNLVADVMFVNNIPFLITMSSGIKFVTVEHITIRTSKQLSKDPKIIMKFYARGSMIVKPILMNVELDSTKDELMGKTVVNNSASKEHVAYIERCIFIVKERCSSVASDLPFNFLHEFIVVNMVYFFILWLIVFPVKNRVSQEFSPRSIVVRTELSWNQHCRINFGDYAKVHGDLDLSNTLTPRTYP